MLKKITATALLVCSMPALASAWTFTTQARNAGGTIDTRNKAGQVVSDGLKFKNYTTSAAQAVRVAALPGFTIRTVTVNGVTKAAPASPYSVSIPGTYSGKSVSAIFAASTIAVTSGMTGGNATPRVVGNIVTGSKLIAPLTFTFMPKAGYAIQTLTLGGADASATGTVGGYSITVTGAKNVLNGAMKVTFAANTVISGSINLVASATTAIQTVTAGNVQTVQAGTTATLTGSVSGAAGTPVYNWIQVQGPARAAEFNALGVVTTPAAPLVLVPAIGKTVVTTSLTTPGKYVFQVKLDSGSTALTSVIVVASKREAAANQCQFCHTANGIGAKYTTATPPVLTRAASVLYSNWSTSKHNTVAGGAMCTDCHSDANNGAHPGAAVTAATCNKCHAATLSTTTHPVALTAEKCITCHDGHNPAENIATLDQSAHPAVTLYTFEEIGMQMAGGAKVPVQVDANGKGMPYSPKQTCGTSGCHIKNGVDYTYDKISDHAFHSNQGRSEYQDSTDGKFNATKNVTIQHPNSPAGPSA